jgi:hypothetical protein
VARGGAGDGALAGVLLQPAVAKQTCVSPNGARLELAFDLTTGVLDWRE